MAGVSCPGVLTTGPAGEALCVDQLGQAVAWDVVPPLAVDWAQAGEPFAAGFTLVVSVWAIAKGVALVVDMVRR